MLGVASVPLDEFERQVESDQPPTVTAVAEQAIQQRRERLLAQSQRAAGLGIPIRRRDDAPKTYAIPTVRKKVAPALPPASTAPGHNAVARLWPNRRPIVESRNQKAAGYGPSRGPQAVP